jgi:hypothetical protein
MTISPPDRASQRWLEALRQTSIGLEELVAGLSERDRTGQCHLSLLWERIDLVISRSHSADVRARLGPQEVTVVRTDSDDVASLEVSEETTRLLHAAPTHPATTLVDSSDAVLRLIYGRSRPHDDLKVVGTAVRSDMVELFPGF